LWYIFAMTSSKAIEKNKFYLFDILMNKLENAEKCGIFASKRILYGAICALFVVLFVDNNIGTIADYLVSFSVSFPGIFLFVCIVAIFLACQIIILKHDLISRELNVIKGRKISIYGIIKYAQYFLLVLMAIILFQILFTSQYFLIELQIAVFVSYTIAVFLIGILSFKLYKWYLASKSIVTLLFGFASTLICVNAIASIILFDTVLNQKNFEIITPTTEVAFNPILIPGTPLFSIYALQAITMAGYYVMTWAATILLLSHHSRRVGRPIFWTIVILPIFFFFYFFTSLFELILPTSEYKLVLTTDTAIQFITYLYSVLLIGGLIAIGFYSVARSIKENKVAKFSLIITGIGFLFYFGAGWSTVIQAAFPPYGLPNVLMVGLASFLIFAGLYNSAVSISRDVYLRNLIKKSVYHESKFLSGMASAQMREELEKIVINLTKKENQVMSKENNIDPSISSEEIKQYVNEVLEEVLKSKK
jgi:hypothetical protein